jgi:phenylpropionate dioxygenase-like ring-hydroxylating dioxygenase large terminal subunit
MLTPAQNERVTRVGPGTPMGSLFRRYWVPAMLSDEAPVADGDPVRVRILGENLVAFRDTDGVVGLIEDACPHRRAPMFFGRNEQHGMRCVYHGWKFDRHGTCTDMPSEPPDSLFKEKVTIVAYPTHEAGGIVWAYLGAPEHRPPAPDFEWTRAPATHRRASKTFEHCNWLQALEGGIDTAHSSWAHNERLGDPTWIRNRDGHPTLDVEKTDYGFRYISTRNMGEDVGKYVRLYHFVMPAMQMRGGVNSWTGFGKDTVPRLDGHIWMPIDDETCYVYNFMWTNEDVPIDDEWYWNDEKRFGRGKDDLLPGYKLKKNPSNDYEIDRTLQRTKNFTGITGINTQDFALQEGMGPIVDRSLERLGTSDKAIIAARQLLLEGTDAVEAGNAPRGTDPATYRSLRPYDAVIPHATTWEEAFAPELVARW